MIKKSIAGLLAASYVTISAPAVNALDLRTRWTILEKSWQPINSTLSLIYIDSRSNYVSFYTREKFFNNSIKISEVTVDCNRSERVLVTQTVSLSSNNQVINHRYCRPTQENCSVRPDINMRQALDIVCRW
ncbi:hypothetical protein N39L_40460 [Limnospira platensis NIES-39]|jgi:hypothetical protein|uniref:Uncharacterized protein n=1 Tax=Limnospira platensis NIES-46 TaxID=1236695 RepID=A0A5M3SY99_LIMPL|nr:hypothetical protein N39L_40460 [Arthrospira platensis NIES-39]GCE92073.1 hypothetical protein NIES46_01080 [Arthrospira platensis NIES-46]